MRVASARLASIGLVAAAELPWGTSGSSPRAPTSRPADNRRSRGGLGMKKSARHYNEQGVAVRRPYRGQAANCQPGTGLKLQGCDSPDARHRLLGLQDAEAVAGAKGVRWAGHGLDGEAPSTPVRFERFAREQHQMRVAVVGPELHRPPT